MSSRLNRPGYEKLIQEDKEWLAANTDPHSLEGQHIQMVLDNAPYAEYCIYEILMIYEGQIQDIIKQIIEDRRGPNHILQTSIDRLVIMMGYIEQLKTETGYRPRIHVSQ